MKSKRQCLLGLLAGLGGVFSVSAAEPEDAGNPYEPIVTRNIFGLLPMVAPTNAPLETEPLVKISLTGVMSIFGRYQALFTTTAPGQPAKNYHVLEEQQSEEGIKVVRINTDAGVVTFNNHGVTQEIALANWTMTNTLWQTLSQPTILAPPKANVPAAYPASFIRARLPDYLGGGPNGLREDQPLPATNQEEQMLLIEAQREYLKSQHDPAADLLPPTALTPEKKQP